MADELDTVATPVAESPARDLKGALAFAAKHFEVDPNVLAGMMMRESNLDDDVISGARKSSTGAIGLMQFMPATAERYGIDPTDPVQSIFGAAAYLKDNLAKFNGDYAKAVAAYNWGENREVFNTPDWQSKLPEETRNYVDFVTSFAHALGSKDEPASATPSALNPGRGKVNPPLVDPNAPLPSPPRDPTTLDVMGDSLRRGVPALMQNMSGTALRANAGIIGKIDSVEQQLASGKNPNSFKGDEDPYGVALMTPDQRKQFREQTMTSAGGNAASITAAEATKADYPAPPVVGRVMAAKTFGEALQQIASDPVKFIAAIGPESLVQSAPGLVAGAVMPGGAVAKAATMGMGSAATDYGSGIIEGLQKAGIDTTNADAVRAAAKDPALLQRIAREAMAHAGPVGAVDAISGGAASKLAMPSRVATKLAGKPVARELVNMAAQVPAQGAMGGAGEALGEVAAGQDISPGNILAEVVGEGFTAPSEVASVGGRAAMERLRAKPDPIHTILSATSVDEAAAAAAAAVSAPVAMKSDSLDGPMQQALKTAGITPETMSAADDFSGLSEPAVAAAEPELAAATESATSPDRVLPGAAEAGDAGRVTTADAAPLTTAHVGKPIDAEWTAFSPESGTRGVPRSEMPQIKAEHRGAMTQFLLARGIEHEQTEMNPADLKPTQAEFSPAKVLKAKEFDGGDRSILVSSDNHVLDGHHQWVAKLESGEPVKVIKLDAPISKLVDEVKEFPSARLADGATETKPVERETVPTLAERIEVMRAPPKPTLAERVEALRAKPTPKVELQDKLAKFSRAPAEEVAAKTLADDKGLYQLTKSDKTTVKEIAAESDPAIQVKESRIGSEHVFKVSMPDGGEAYIWQRKPNPYGPDVYGYKMKDGEAYDPILERPGAPADNTEKVGEVFVDVSRLKSGGDGRFVYNIASNYAKNTGRVFIGDPSGLSDKAMRRRTEQMLSSAIKHGTTDHLAPHPRQAEGDPSIGVPAMKWTDGDHDANIRELIRVSHESFENAGGNPITFEPETGRFTDSSGRELDDGAIRQAVRSGSGPAGDAGLSTAKRDAVLSALVQREGGGALGPDGRRMGVLERLVQLRREHATSLENLFYSRKSDKLSERERIEQMRRTSPAAERESRVKSEVARLRRITGEPKAADRAAQVENLVARIKGRWSNAPEVVVVKSFDDPAIPEKIRADERQQRSQGASGEPEGLFHDGRVYLVADKLPGDADVVRVLLHEVLGHHGLQGAFGKGLNPILDRVALLNPDLVRAKAKDYGEDVTTVKGRRTAAEEVLAELAQTSPENTVVQQAIAAIRTWLRENVPGFDAMKLSDAEIIRNFIEPARRHVAEGPTIEADDSARFSRANYTPEQRSALERAGVGGPPTMAGKIRKYFAGAVRLLSDRREIATAFHQGALNQFHGIDRAIKQELGNLPVEQDPYIAARLANGGASSVMRGLMLHGQAKWAANGQHLEKIEGSKGLLEILAPVANDLDSFFGWMIGNRAARLMKEGRERNFTADDIKALQSLSAGKEDSFKAMATEYAAFKRSVLDIAQDAGLLDPNARRVWDQADYVPFYRQIDEKATFGATGKKGLAGQSSGIRTLKGGEAALNDPMENILMNFSRLVDASLKNNAIAKTVAVLDDAGSDIVSKIGYDMTQATVPASEVREALVKAGTPQSVLDVIPEEAFDGMAKMWAIKAPDAPDVVRVMVDGKPQFYRVDDPILLRALTSFVPFDFPGMGVLRLAKRVLTGSVTAMPDFMARNFIRDSMATQMITPNGFHPAKSLTSIVKSYKESGGAQSMLFAGASFQSGHVNAADPQGTAIAMRRALRVKGFDASSANEFVASILDTPAKFWEKYRHVGEAIENANREAVYEAAKNAGRSETAAAFEAKDLMDFSLRGSSPFYQVFADTVPFLNARVQGMYRLGRTDPKRLAAYGMLMMTASLLLAMSNSDREEYDQLPDWDKDSYWHVWIGGKHFRIPKPFELGVVFATVPERIFRYAKGKDTGSKLAHRLWANVRDQLAMDYVPQALRPIMNAWGNKDTFRDAPIEGLADEGKLPSQRYSTMTSDTAKAVVKAIAPVADEIGLSPKKLEYLVSGYFGTAGQYALGLSDMAVRQFEGKPPTPSLRLDDIPVVKSFYREEPARATVYESDLYELRSKVAQIYRSANALEREGEEVDAKKMREQHKAELAVREPIENAAQQLKSINKERESVYSHKTMPPEEKRKQIDQLLKERAKVARDAMMSPASRAAQ